MTHVMGDQDGSTGDISAFDGGRGGASGGTLSHAASDETTAIDISAKFRLNFAIVWVLRLH